MRHFSRGRSASILPLLAAFFLMTGCLTARKMDKQVARQYGNRIPPVRARTDDAIQVTCSLKADPSRISTSRARMSRFLPLLFYWHSVYENTCTLNPAIAVHRFEQTLYEEAHRKLGPQLKGRKLQLCIRQLPHSFVFVDNFHTVFALLYYVSWEKLSIEHHATDMVVSYKLLDGADVVRTGKITVDDEEKENGLHMFESWKRAVAVHISAYNHQIDEMSRSFVDQMAGEL